MKSPCPEPVQQRGPARRARSTAMKSEPRLPQLEGARVQRGEPSTAESENLTDRQSRGSWLRLKEPSPITGHWVAYQENLFLTWERAFLAHDKLVVKCLPNLGHNSNQKGGDCKRKNVAHHPVLQGSSHKSLKPLKGICERNSGQVSGWDCALGKRDRTDPQVVRAFQNYEPNFLHLPILRKALILFIN